MSGSVNLRLAVGCIRQSDLHRQQHNHSQEQQKTEIEVAAAAMGYKIVEFFSEFESAFHTRIGSRDATANMIDYVLASNDILAVFFFHLDRASRQGGSDLYYEVVEVLTQHNPDIKIISAVDRNVIDFHDPMNQIKLVLARDESEKKSQRTLSNIKADLQKDLRPGSVAPYGMLMVNKKLYKNSKAPIVYLIFYLAYWGHSDSEITELLNVCNVDPPGKGGGGWSASTINYILNNRVYLGDLQWNSRQRVNGKFIKSEGTLFSKVHEAIVPLYLWQGVHDLRQLKRSSPNFVNTSNFLLGFATCSKKGHGPLSVKNNTPSNSKYKYVYYRCGYCRESVRAERVHEEFMQQLRSKYIGVHGRRNAIVATGRSVLISEVQNSIRELGENIKTVEFNMSRPIPAVEADIYDRALRALRKQLSDKNRELDVLLIVDGEQREHEQIVAVNDLEALTCEEIRAMCFHMKVQLEVDFSNSRANLKFSFELPEFC